MARVKFCLLSGCALVISLIVLFLLVSDDQNAQAATAPHAVPALASSAAIEAAATAPRLRRSPAQPPSTDAATPVLLHAASQRFPDVDGPRVVWQDARFGPTEIFMKDLATGEISNITNSTAWEVLPDLDGDVVVWKDGYAGVGIHGVDLTTSELFTVTSGHGDVSRPRLSGDVVVWADDRAGKDDWNIYGYDLTTQREFVISDAAGQQRDPQIDGDYMVWWDEEGQIRVYDLVAKEVIAVLDTVAGHLPDVSMADQLVVWQDWRNGDLDIYGYDLTTETEKPLVVATGQQEAPAIANGLLAYQNQVDSVVSRVDLLVLGTDAPFPVTENPNIQQFPAVDGSRVVWADNRNHQMDIYLFEWQGVPPIATSPPLSAPISLQAGAFPGGRIRLQWQESSQDAERFVIERTPGITGTVWSTIAEVSANTTVYTDTPGILGESYWYRVRAKNADGLSGYTNDSFNSTFDAVPSPDEQYLMVLVNEARLAPSAFGYSSHAPLPPVAWNASLAYSARSHSQSILNSRLQFGHCDTNGRCAGDRAVAAGYPHNRCTETLTTGATGPDAMGAAHQSFLKSDAHRAILLDPNADEFGVGHTYTAGDADGWMMGQVTTVFCARDGVVPPAVPVGAVVPYTGTAETEFTYTANFYDADGQAPVTAEVVIDGVPHALTLSTGTAAGGTYRYITTLGPSTDHSYYFRFEQADGTVVRWPQTGSPSFPDTYSGTEPDLVPSLHITTHVDYFEIQGDIYNAGINAAPNVSASLYLGDPNAGGELLHEELFAAVGGGEHHYLAYTWSPPVPDTYTFYLWVRTLAAGTSTQPPHTLVAGSAEIELRNVYLPLAINEASGP